MSSSEDTVTVLRDREREQPAIAGGEIERALAGPCIPDMHVRAVADRDDALAVGRHRDLADRAVVLERRRAELADERESGAGHAASIAQGLLRRLSARA